MDIQIAPMVPAWYAYEDDNDAVGYYTGIYTPLFAQQVQNSLHRTPIPLEHKECGDTCMTTVKVRFSVCDCTLRGIGS